MASRPKSGITADTDVNLDFLTKEEKEALLSKKMDMIRQRNKALTERHKLIEADKKKAEEAGQAVKPTVDSQTLPAEGAPKSRGRGRGQPPYKDGNRPAKERPKSSGDFRDSSNYEPIVDTTDLANYRSKGGPPIERDIQNNNTPRNKRKPVPKEEATFTSNFEYEPIIDMKDLDKRFGALLNTSEVGSLPHTDHGPPPDPSFNPLADRRRSDKKEESMDHRRHPRNYGGSTDLSRVKQSMKNMREKEKERPQGIKPLEMVMTGKERRNHEEWKAERDRYDKERIQRQMSDAGNWKRAWDADKSSQENDDHSASYSPKVEPAKRPAGRIGSGRFDRGERDERPRSAIIGKGALQIIDNSQQQQRQHHDQQQMQAQLHPHIHPQAGGESKSSRGRGRGRGRGRSRGGGPGEKFPRPRTWSGGDDRFVECQKELLLVKFDNTAGDNSVEVEYDDDEFIASPLTPPKTQLSGTMPGRGPTGRTPNQAPKQQSRGGKQQQLKNKAPRHKDKSHVDGQQTPTEDKWNPSSPISVDEVVVPYDNDEARVRTSSHSQSYGDSEEWEDCTESSGMHDEEEDFGLSGTTTDNSAHDLHLECRLNPEAPEFLPSSPDLIKTPSLHPKIVPWTTTNGSLSCTTPQGSVTSLQPHTQDSLYQHSPTKSPGSSAKRLQWREEADISSKGNLPSSLSPEESSLSLKTPEMKQADGNKDALISDTSVVNFDGREHVKVPKIVEIPKSMDGSASLRDVSFCMTTNNMPPVDSVDNINAASDASNKLKEDGASSIKAASPQVKTTTGLISAFLDKGFEQNSSLESMATFKEPSTILATEIVQNPMHTKDFLRNVSKIHDPCENISKTMSICPDRAMNGGVSAKHKLSDESAVTDDHTPVTFSELETTTKISKEGCGNQEDHKEAVANLAIQNGTSSDATIQAGSQYSLREDKPALPTADVSVYS